MKKINLCSAFLAMAFVLVHCKKDPVTTPADGPYFPKVKVIVQNNCLSCHQLGGQGMPVILETDDDIVAHAESIKSSVIDPATFLNKRMPLNGELPQADKDVIQKWFDKGGKQTD